MDIVTEQKKYFEAKLTECSFRPDLNAFQKKIFEEYVEMASRGISTEELADFIESRGNYFDMAQAEQLDRYANMIKIQQFYKNKKRKEYYTTKFETVKHSVDHNALSNDLTTIESSISDEEKRSTMAIQELLNLYLKTVEYITAPDSKRQKYLAEIKEKWALLKNLDSDISLQKILTYPPYRHISIFEDERITELFNNIKEVIQ
jgi:hypothetical protein